MTHTRPRLAALKAAVILRLELDIVLRFKTKQRNLAGKMQEALKKTGF